MWRWRLRFNKNQLPLKQTEHRLMVKLQRVRKDPDHFSREVRNNNSVLSVKGPRVPGTEKPNGPSEQRRKCTRAAGMH